MSTSSIKDLFGIEKRFMRSAHIERDFNDPTALEGYVVTDPVRIGAQRLSSGLSEGSAQRSWRITGDYGAGKSSFALLIAHLFSGKESDLPPQIRKCTALKPIAESNPDLLPILVVGSRQSIAQSVCTALYNAILPMYSGRGRKPESFVRLKKALSDPAMDISDEEALALVRDTNSDLIIAGKCTGLLILLDELGKFLEFSALHPERQDIFFLQQLAELASRSGDEPIFAIGLLHQGFNAYANQLSQVAQKEWEKVAGRFEEILFDQPLDQTAHLIANALNVSTRKTPKGLPDRFKEDMVRTIGGGFYGAAPPVESLSKISHKLYPLHPTVIPVLVKFFSRFGQNERSLFSFLLSNEPFGLGEFANQKASVDSVYRIHDFYDYIAANFGHRLSNQTYRNQWNHIDSLIQSFPVTNDLELKVLKTVGLLNLINSPDLVPNEANVLLSINSTRDAKGAKVTSKTLQSLHGSKKVLYLRGQAGGYCLWSHSSVNLDSAYEDAKKAVPVRQKVASSIQEKLTVRPIVARRHYIQTGNLRYFEVTYCSIVRLEKEWAKGTGEADGKIIIPLCETAEEVQVAEQFAKLAPEVRSQLMGIPEPLVALNGLVQEVERWAWVQKNVPEIKDDQYATEELSRQLSTATATLDKRLQHFVGLTSNHHASGMRWYHSGQTQSFASNKALVSYLSELCDELFDQAPVIHNELVNRSRLSSAAAAARMRLIGGILERDNLPILGMDPERTPPEKAIYLSLLKQSKIHVRKGDEYQLQLPTKSRDPLNLAPAFKHIQTTLEREEGCRVPILELFNELKSPPFGVKEGVLPILLTIFLTQKKQDVALYEEGTFLSEYGLEEILRLTKRPHHFEIQSCQVKGMRKNLFSDIAQVLKIEETGENQTKILDVVRPLCVFVAQLPEYSQKTKSLSVQATQVRAQILDAKDPYELLFTELPKACGHEPFSSKKRTKDYDLFVQELKRSLDEIRNAYVHLQARIFEQVMELFDAGDSNASSIEKRELIAERASQILVEVADLDLKAFCLRLFDSHLAEREWIESVGSFIITRPPSVWKDDDESIFVEKFRGYVEKFKRVETLKFASQEGSSFASAMRVGLTQVDGKERNEVIYLDRKEIKELPKLKEQIHKLLPSNRKLSTAALSELMWSLMEEQTSQEN